jgi:hypothetical protein
VSLGELLGSLRWFPGSIDMIDFLCVLAGMFEILIYLLMADKKRKRNIMVFLVASSMI